MAEARDGVDQSGEARWRAALATLLKGADVDGVLVARSQDDLPVGPLYPKAETPTSVLWRNGAEPIRIVARIDHPDALQARRLADLDMAGGVTGLTLTCAGAATARGFGIQAEMLADVLADLPGKDVALHLEASPFAAGEAVRRSLARILRAGEEREIDWGLDPLGDLARCEAAPAGWPDLAASATQTITVLRRDGFTGPVLRVDGRPAHEAGGSEAQELAALLGCGVAYLRVLEAAGLDETAMQAALSFTVAVDADQILGIAKLRALRLLWVRIEEASGLTPRPLRLHAETAWRMATRRDPASNLLRNTVACAAAILGGADAVCVLPDTVALGPPDAAARRRARNIAILALEEAHLGRVDDPAAGAGSFEALTLGLCDAAWRLFQDIEGQGGMPAALLTGFWQAEVAVARARRRALLVSGAMAIVGTTVFADATDRPAIEPIRLPARLADPAWTRLEALPCWRDDELAEGHG